MKKLLCVFCAAALLVSLAACGKKQQTTAAPTESLTDARAQYIAAEVAENLEKIEVLKTDQHTYYRTSSEGKQVLCRTDQQGRLKILLHFKNNPTYYPETYERSSRVFLYFTYKMDGDATAKLYALNLSNDRIMTVMSSPCSNFVTLNLPNTFEMYGYGFIAGVDGIKVIDLSSGGVSSKYSMTIAQMKSFFVKPDEFPEVFFSSSLTTSLSDMDDRKHIRIDLTEKDKKGNVKNKWAVKFEPTLSVALEIKDETKE